MKKTFIIIALFALMSFAANEKYINVRFSDQQLNSHWKNLEAIKKIVDESNLPHAQVKFILKSIDSLERDIKKTARLDTTGLAITPKRDTISKNPVNRRSVKPQSFVPSRR